MIAAMITGNVFILLIIAAAAPPPASCTPDPALAALFTPVRPELGRYEACTAPEPLDDQAEALEALDAFGAAGPYSRSELQHLYGGQRVRVRRSWTADGAEFVSITRLSPYPDAALKRLNAGTLEIRWYTRR
jgi:hypothetical protein